MPRCFQDYTYNQLKSESINYINFTHIKNKNITFENNIFKNIDANFKNILEKHLGCN